MRSFSRDMKGVRGVILDFRNNGGGDTEAMTEIASAFLPGGTALGLFTARDGGIALAPQTRNATIFSSDPLFRFTGPMVILVGDRTSSAAEIFTSVMKQSARATVIGQPTCGCVLGIRGAHSLPDGGSLEVSEMDFKTPSGIRLEGNPIAPDRQVQVTTEDIRRGRDRAVAEATSLLKSLVR
jgi:C-terminal processing protease CtpA/Prc